MKSLTIRVFGGLCNRLMAIDAALSLIKSNNSSAKLIVEWEKNKLLNAAYADLFEQNDDFEVVDFPETNKIFRLAYRLFNRMSYDLFIDVNKYSILWKEKKDFTFLFQHRKVFLECFCDFHQSLHQLRFFIPKEHILLNAKKIIASFSENTIGVHIRRTDHSNAIAKSTSEKFYTLLKTELAANADTRFFIATDDPSELEQLNLYFPNKTISFTSDFNRNSKSGIEDAVVDWLCLAATKKIYGSFNSTFSSTAAQRGSVPLVIVQ